MPQQPIEIILVRQLAEYLSAPIFVVDPEGRLVYYNEAAQGLLGRSFEEAGEMTVDELGRLFQPLDENGAQLPVDGLPLAVALRERRPVNRKFHIETLDGRRRALEATAIPLVGQGGKLLGAAAFFWSRP